MTADKNINLNSGSHSGSNSGSKASATYAEAGVNIEAGNKAVQMMKAEVAKTKTDAVLSSLGSFGSLYDLKYLFEQYKHPVMVQSIDGVGTKSIVAQMAENYSNLGEDLLSATANDILVMGAKPLTLLDYIASDSIDPENIAQLVNGLAKACQREGVALVGGETAEMPDTYLPGAHDFVGIVSGVVDKDNIIDNKDVKPGDVLIGLSSSGLHTNGFSLARYLLFKQNNYQLDYKLSDNNSLEQALLAPHINYQKPVMDVLNSTDNPKQLVKAMVHVTGGGFLENIPRVLPDNCAVEINLNSFPKLPIFDLLVKLGNLSEQEAYRTFNMGIGYIFIVPQEHADKVIGLCQQAYKIGEVVNYQPNSDNLRVKLVNK